MILGTPPDLHGSSKGPRRPRSPRAGRSLGEVTIGVGTVDPRGVAASGGVVSSSVDYEWNGTLADQLTGTNTPTNGSTGLQEFPEQGGEDGATPFEAYLGPRNLDHDTRIDLGAADTITLRIWLYADYTGPPDFTVQQPSGHHFDLRIGTLLDISVSDDDLIWEEKADQTDWLVAAWHWRGHLDVDGRAINDYCIANGESPPYQITRDFGTAYGGDGYITWSPWYPAGSLALDHIILEWLTVYTVPPTDGRLVGDPVILAGQSSGRR